MNEKRSGIIMAITAAASTVKLSYVASCEQNSLGAVLEGVEKIILNDGEDYTARIKNVNARTMVIKAIKDVVSIICDVISLSLSFCRRRQLGSLND